MVMKRFPLCKLFGFQVWIDWSWFILAMLITWSLAKGLFPMLHAEDNLSTTVFWGMGVAGAIGLFVSIVLHELGHSVIARRFGMQMKGITLFIFGGVAEMGDEPPSARAEFYMAIAGPIVSVIIGASMLTTTLIGNRLGWAVPIVGVTGWLGWINLVLVVFNMIPAFPLDGGRVLRAALWHFKGDLRRATRISSTIGSAFGIVLIVFGALNFFAGNIIGGVWWVVIGLFLRGAASSSYQQLLIRRALEGESVSRFMRRSPIVVPPDITITELIEDYFYHHYHKLYPVMDNGHISGCVSIGDIKSIPKDEWSSRRVGDIADECDEKNTVRPTDDAMQAMTKMNRSGASRLMVIEDDQLVGILSLKDLMRFLSLKVELEDDK